MRREKVRSERDRNRRQQHGKIRVMTSVRVRPTSSPAFSAAQAEQAKKRHLDATWEQLVAAAQNAARPRPEPVCTCSDIVIEGVAYRSVDAGCKFHGWVSGFGERSGLRR